MRITAALLALVLWPVATAAHHPEDVDPAMAPWFESLTRPEGGSCCNNADCFVLLPADLKIADGSYWVRDPAQGNAEWLRVPAEHIIPRYDNPTGKVVACVHFHQVLCFVKVGAT